jgi:hypothetical protein
MPREHEVNATESFTKIMESFISEVGGVKERAFA